MIDLGMRIPMMLCCLLGCGSDRSWRRSMSTMLLMPCLMLGLVALVVVICSFVSVTLPHLEIENHIKFVLF